MNQENNVGVLRIKKTSKRMGKAKYSKYGYFFVAPFIIAFILFQLYPIIYTFVLSFTDLAGWETKLDFVGVKNYVAIVKNSHFIRALQNTWIIWVINFVPQIAIALMLAKWFTDTRIKLKGAGLFKTTFYMPNIITAASVAILFYTLFSYPVGPVNQILMKLNVLAEPFDFFRSKTGTRLIVAFIQFWMWYGSTFIVISAGILGINPSLFEAARIDGASSWQIFKKITLPLLRPITLYVLITSLVGGMQMFDIPFLLTNGAPDFAVETLTMYIYKQAFTGNRNFYVAATASIVLLVIVLLISLVIFKFMNRHNKEGVNK
ncbi:sugar ABC transporter permease [Vallitalea pronyensis]|uniref:Sugar ABC transporter permease n=1 Tax=Vallitalea pronyensis TaxID=1348613 RepID=A0A8J8SFX1_9FIRM|nr:sugar ABC transporter permease [Vallitalea pronyensis]QUI21779.1 sugar ABC transporter permease [Vallitalea pronyensis]